jgi:hypothetical protein
MVRDAPTVGAYDGIVGAARWPIAVLVLATGCQQILGLRDLPGDGGDGDGHAFLDAPHVFMDVSPPPNLCFGSQGPTGYYFCLPSLPTTSLQLTGAIDTTACIVGTVPRCRRPVRCRS